MANVRLSKRFTLQWVDTLRGALLAALSSALTLLYELIGKDPINWINVRNVAAVAFIGYLIKNFAVEPAKVTVTADTNTKAVNATDRIKEVV